MTAEQNTKSSAELVPVDTPVIDEVPDANAEPEAPPAPKFVKTSIANFPMAPSLYIIEDADALDEIDEIEGGMYYVLASTEVSSQSSGTGTSSVTTKQIVPALYKRIRNISGHGLVRVFDGKRAGLGQVKESVFMTLPRMPLDFIDKIEYFFRKVDDEATGGSEAIVILGFDKDYLDTEDPSAGWVCLVPEQSNTAAHCKYEKDTILDEKSDSTLIVGTIHSHPGMSAYASHTDAGDQYDNDGLHITIGWIGQVTEYHCEYQMGNRRYDLKPEQCFETVPKGTYDVGDWLTKVKKPAPWSGNGSTAGRKTTGGGGSQQQSGHTGAGSSSDDPTSRIFGEWYRAKHNKDRPSGCPDILENTLIAVVRIDDEACPVCAKEFDRFSARNRRCTACFTYLSLAEDDGDLRKIAEERKEAYKGMDYMPGLEFFKDPDYKSKYPVLVWDRDATEIKDRVRCIFAPKSGIMGSGLGKALGASV